MSSKSRRSRRKRIRRIIIALLCIALVFGIGIFAASKMETLLSRPVENAGQLLTSYQKSASGAQYFVNGQWMAEKDVETLLVIGIDDFGGFTSSDSYLSGKQSDFLVLLVRDKATGESRAIHLDRDAMVDVPVLGVTGQRVGTRNLQLALSFNFGRGEEDSCKNVVNTVSNLLYGIEIDHYIAFTMDAVPVLNDWAGGVTVEVMDDFKDIDSTLVQGQTVELHGQHALNYVRARRGLNDSSNHHRMERHRQYASAWMTKAEPLMSDTDAMMDLIVQLSDLHYSDCTASKLMEIAETYAGKMPEVFYELDGTYIPNGQYLEYHLNEDAVQQLVLDLFYVPAEQ